MGSDCPALMWNWTPKIFQSTLPVWGATSKRLVTVFRPSKFQSTLPVWGATSADHGRVQLDAHFNPRSPCGERLVLLPNCKTLFIISIHAPRVGSDRLLRALGRCANISIHAPRVGSDTKQTMSLLNTMISIHAPRVGSDHKWTGSAN